MTRDAVGADARRLGEFGARTFEVAFGADNSRDDMAAYLSAAFNEQRQLEELQDSGRLTQLLGDIESRAVDRGADVIWLGVWEHNPRAQAFYRKHGYVDVGHHTFTLGRDVQIDRIMTRTLARRP